MRYLFFVCLCVFAVFPARAQPVTYSESPVLTEKVRAGELAPVEQRLPQEPYVVNFESAGKKPGLYGGTLRMLMARAKDVRLMTVYGYARLLRYDAQFNLTPDILERIAVDNGRNFTLTLRAGHKWSDGAPFTSEDFRYYWEDVANNTELSPVGPPNVFRVDGELPRFKVLDERTVEFRWSKANPYFLEALARSRPIFIYRPAHYLKQFHARYGDQASLDASAKAAGVRNWAGVHNRMDNPYRFDNPDLPTLQPWYNSTALPAERFIFLRNPYYHRVDPEGRQLPYIDSVVMTVANKRLIAAKTSAGESDLQARYLRFDNLPLLKSAEDRVGYRVHTWRVGKGSHLALYPNMNADDPGWRDLMQDARFRRALSLGINREEINKALYYGLAMPAQNTLLPDSPLYRADYKDAWATFDLERANKILDDMGLTVRNRRGIRLMNDGRPIEIIIETAGENTEEPDVLQLIQDSWNDIGIKLHVRPSHRDVLRNRIFAGDAVMSISSGWENALANADSAPTELAPTQQIQYQWPRWGQFTETAGQAGAPPDIPSARRLLHLLDTWSQAPLRQDRAKIWHEMLRIHAEHLFVIGIIYGTLQPVVVNARLRNVPEEGIYNWEPGGHLGVHQPDTFWFVPKVGSL